jgi:hypothetical protein
VQITGAIEHYRRLVDPSCQGAWAYQRHSASALLLHARFSRLSSFSGSCGCFNNAHSLCKLTLGSSNSCQSGLTALVNALREHRGLHKFTWNDFGSRRGPRHLSLDSVLLALPGCPHLRKVAIATNFAGANALKILLQLHLEEDLYLALEKEHWLVVCDEIRLGRCNVQRLTLALPRNSNYEATEAVKAVSSSIQMDRNLEHLTLRMEDGFTDEAGVALAKALTVNNTLRKSTLSNIVPPSYQARNIVTLDAPAFEAFSAMLRVNTSLILTLPSYEPAGADERLRESRKQMRIEQRLNEFGGGRLSASR